MEAFLEAIGEVSLLSLQQDYQRCTEDSESWHTAVALSETDCTELARRIAALPLEYRSILFFRYCFHQSVAETEDMLQTQQAVGKLRYLRKLLSGSMGLHNEIISDACMETACTIAISGESMIDGTQCKKAPKYSQDFRRRLRQIPAAQARMATILLMAKRVAVIFLIFAISFSTALVADATLRQRFFNWIVETFPQYSVFKPQRNQGAPSLDAVEIGYIPDGYMLANKINFDDRMIFEYMNEQRYRLVISISNSDTITYALNTEGVEPQQIEYKDGEAIWWYRDEFNYFVWQQEGFSCYIITNADLEKILEIAKNIKF